MDYMDKHGKKIECKISYIPVQLCEFPNKNLVLVVVYGFGVQPMLLLTNLDISEKKKLCMIATKVYLMRWRIEEYFKFKKQQFGLEDLRVLARTHSGIKGFLLKKEQSQQLTLAHYFSIAEFE